MENELRLMVKVFEEKINQTEEEYKIKNNGNIDKEKMNRYINRKLKREIIILNAVNIMPSALVLNATKRLNEERKRIDLTIEDIETTLGSQSPHHWFSAESYPSVEDWDKLKDIGFVLSKFDKQMTEMFTKSSEKTNVEEGKRNKRTTWTICPRPFKEAHFAVYPEELCETPIKAGCPEFVCVKCSMPKIMETKLGEVISTGGSSEGERAKIEWRGNVTKEKQNHSMFTGDMKQREHIDLGYKPICKCNAGFTGGIVLDPFFGAGTTGLVALKQNKKFLGIELNKEYIEIAEKRLKPFLEQKTLKVPISENKRK